MSNKEKDSSSGKAFQLKQKTLFSQIKRLCENAMPAEIAFRAKLDVIGVDYIFLLKCPICKSTGKVKALLRGQARDDFPL